MIVKKYLSPKPFVLVVLAAIGLSQLYIVATSPVFSWDWLDYWSQKTMIILTNEQINGSASPMLQDRHPPGFPYFASLLSEAAQAIETGVGLVNYIVVVALLFLLSWLMVGGSLPLMAPAILVLMTIPIFENHLLTFGYTEMLTSILMAILGMHLSEKKLKTSQLPVLFILALGLVTLRNTGWAYVVLLILCRAQLSILQIKKKRVHLLWYNWGS